MKHPSSFQFMSKFISYQGLLVFLPYVIINILTKPQNPISEENYGWILLLTLLLFGIMVMFDFWGIKSKFLDNHSRSIIIFLALVGTILLINISVLISTGWDNSNIFTLVSIFMVIIIYLLIGWFFIRSEETNRPSAEVRPIRSSAYCFLGSAVIWGLGYSVDFLNLNSFINAEIVILAGLAFSFILYPIITIVASKNFVESEKRVVLSKREKLVAVTDFLWDSVKIVLLIITFYIFSYNGEVLFPSEAIINDDPSLYRRNLMWLLFSASLVALIVEQLEEEKLLGKFLVTMVLVAAFLQFVFVEIFLYRDQWLFITILNGITMAGVFLFIEKKILKSGNVAVLPGIMFFIIFFIQFGSILMNNPNYLEFQPYISWFRLLISIGGLFYVYIRLKFMPEKSGEYQIKYSLLGKKIVDFNSEKN